MLVREGTCFGPRTRHISAGKTEPPWRVLAPPGRRGPVPSPGVGPGLRHATAATPPAPSGTGPCLRVPTGSRLGCGQSARLGGQAPGSSWPIGDYPFRLISILRSRPPIASFIASGAHSELQRRLDRRRMLDRPPLDRGQEGAMSANGPAGFSSCFNRRVCFSFEGSSIWQPSRTFRMPIDEILVPGELHHPRSGSVDVLETSAIHCLTQERREERSSSRPHGMCFRQCPGGSSGPGRWPNLTPLDLSISTGSWSVPDGQPSISTTSLPRRGLSTLPARPPSSARSYPERPALLSSARHARTKNGSTFK